MEGADDQEPENLCSRVKLDWCSVQIRKGQIMIGPAVSQLVYLLNEAFLRNRTRMACFGNQPPLDYLRGLALGTT